MAPSICESDLRTKLPAPESIVALDQLGQIDAAVLIPIFFRNGDAHVVFTERRKEMRRHGGEISFPGGRQDTPTENLLATALREADEEIGLNPADVEVLGGLEPLSTFVTKFNVYPFVGLITPTNAWRPSPHEVEAIFEFSVDQLQACYSRKWLIRHNVPILTHAFDVEDRVIWGVTARILANLFTKLGGSP